MTRRFSSRRNRPDPNQMPEVNLVPMMDVLMTVLTFFIIVSMTFNAQIMAGINLPRTEGEGVQSQQRNTANQLVVGLNPQGEIMMDERQLSSDELADRLVTFLNQNPDGQVILKADRGLDFRAVQDLLKTMRDIGGDRVSLSISQQG
ncbi:biopolymer transporter ExbD [Phormidium tenue FACHB-886]|nr:biopolymer transporter ExbD [Phormidium tenue FACHB-886]